MLTHVTVGGLRRMMLPAVAIHALGLAAWASYGGGSGMAADPYLIFTADQLNEIGAHPKDLDKHFKLMADLDLRGYDETSFRRIGTPEDGPFTGTFDGNYKTLSNFQWSCEWARYVGLFGFVDGDRAQITNLTLVNAGVVTEFAQYVGGLVGLIRSGTIVNCHVRGGVISGDNCVGALVGKREGGVIADCTACAVVRGASRVGGLVGFSYWGLTNRCHAMVELTATSSESECYAAGGLIGQSEEGIVSDCHAGGAVEGVRDVGGFVGLNLSTDVRRCWVDGVVRGQENVGGLIGQNDGGVISDCYSLARATGGVFVGGLVGCHAPSCTCTVGVPGVIERCYAAGSVSGASDIGGLIAVNYKSDVTDSFWDIEATGCKSSAGGTAVSTSQLRSLATFLSAGWDFVGEKHNGIDDIWRPPTPDTYPRLAWQAVTGDLDGDGNVDFQDFAILARQWRRIDNGFWSHGTTLSTDGLIDLDDLSVLANGWLAGRR